MPSLLDKIVKDTEFVKKLNRPRVKIDPKKELGSISLVKHLRRLTFDISFNNKGEKVSTVGIYARRYFGHNSEAVWYLEAAKDSGFEGWSCIDDTARAVVLGIKISKEFDELYKRTKDKKYKDKLEEITPVIKQWLNFILYMQNEDNSITNFILDFDGKKNNILENSKKSKSEGSAWAIRALWALASAYSYYKDEEYKKAYLELFQENAATKDYTGLLIISALEILSVDKSIKFNGKRVDGYLQYWCEDILEYFDGYFVNGKVEGALNKEIHAYAYHQLEAMARAGVYFHEEKYIKACDETIKNFIQKNLYGGFYNIFPEQKDNQEVYGISSIIQGLFAMYEAAITGNLKFMESSDYYADLALAYTLWMYRVNKPGAVMWFPNEGYCFDNIAEDREGDISAGTACGAESAIEAGFIQLIINKLTNRRNDWLVE